MGAPASKKLRILVKAGGSYFTLVQHTLNGFGIWKNLRFGKIKTLNDCGKHVGEHKQNFR